MFNELKYPHCVVKTVDGSDRHVVFKLKGMTILFIYKPPKDNCIDFYEQYIRPYANDELLILQFLL